MTNSTTNSSPAALGSKTIGQLLLQYSLPAVIASVATSLYNIIDSIFIGRGVGAMAISGLAITFPLMNLVIGFCTLIAVGGATISSIFLGQKNHAKASETLKSVTILCLIHAIIFGGLTLLFLDPILYFFGATAGTIQYAREFMRVILLGTPISYVFIGLNNLMRATGYPKKAMISAILSVGVNIILAPIFIFIFNWGIAGAALATICAQFCAFIWVLSHFISKKSYVHYSHTKNIISSAILKRIYAIGLSPFLMNCCACLVVVFLNKALLTYAESDGDIAVGAYGIINRTTMFFVMIIFGITQGMQPILGYNLGAGNWERVKETLRKGIFIASCVAIIGWLLTESFPDFLSSMFTTDKAMIEIARTGFRIYFICFPLVGAQIVIQNFFQSIGMPKLSIFLSLTRQLIFLLPLLWTLPRIFGVKGVWLSMAGGDTLAFVLALITITIVTRHQERKLNNI